MRNNSTFHPPMKHIAGMAIALFLLVFSSQRALSQADLCANAGVVTCGTSLTGQSNVGATNDAFPACNTNGTLATGAPNVWYTFVGTGQSVTVSTCANTSFDSEIGIFSGSCGSLVCVVGNDNDICGSSDETVTFNSVAGTNYFIMVQGHASGTGTFTLDVTCAAPPADPCAAPIETIACASSKSVSLTGSGAGWNVTACGFSTPGAEKVYSFTPTVTGLHTLQVTAANGTFIDYFFKDASGGCSSTGWTCIDDISSFPTSTTFGPLTAGTTYLILLDDENTTSSTATFQINCPAPPVDPCAAPIETIACASAKTVTLTGAGGGWSPNNCGFSTPGAEKVYSFTPTVTGIHTLQVTAADGTFIDYFFKDASGGCSSTGWTCIDDVSSSPTSTSFGPLTAGTTYLILLDDETSASTTHTFQINCPAPPDPCAVPIETLICNDTTTVTLVGAGAGWSPGNCGFSTPGAEKVYSFTATVTGIHVLQVTSATSSFIDYFFKDASGGCSSTGWSCIDDIISPSSVNFGPLTAGTTYYILLDAENSGTVTHTFQINCPAPPVDPCAMPIETLICADTTTINLTGTGGGWSPGSCGFSTPGEEKVYSFTATASGIHTLQVTAADGNYIDYFFKDASGGCSSTGWTCIDDVNLPSSASFGPLTVGTTYYILLDGEGTTSRTHTFRINCPAPTSFPANGAATVACPALVVAPTPPTYTSPIYPNCGPITPSGPVITDVPNPLSCEGTRTYSYAYVNCELGLEGVWSFVYTIEREPFTVPANGAATVACPANATQPVPPVVVSNCGENIVPTGPVIGATPACEGTKTYTWTYTDCEGNSLPWVFTYTIERNPFTVPANGAATVACPANATQPVPPVVLSNCVENIVPTGPVIGATPACEGTKTFTWTYTDCEGNSLPWVFTYTIERNTFTVPANGAATVACPANATQPVPPVVLSNCGETITPTGPVVANVPNPLTCEGTRTYTWTFIDCEGNSLPWSFVYTIERQPFTIATPNGAATVDCPDDTDVVPVPPVVTSNCGEVLTSVRTETPKPLCEGTRTYTFTYTDCEGNTANWKYVYTVEYEDFIIPTSIVGAVECPVNAFVPTPVSVNDNCGNLLVPVGPTVTSTQNPQGCEASRKYEWIYTDCEGNSHAWSQTFLFEYNGDFFAPLDEENYVTCLAYAVKPVPQTLYDYCGLPIAANFVGVTQDIAAGGCTGWRKYSFVYTDCGGHSHPWNFTYYINDNEGPLGTCPSGSASGGNGPVSVSVRDLACIEEVPCPADYDFMPKVEELLEAGNYFDVCDGANVIVTLDSWSDLWECSDPDGDGVYTFGRTFYFRIADHCGNEYASLCEVTYSGECQPIETFRSSDWGVAGGAPGTSVSASTSDLQVISTLLNNNPLTIGGGNRSLKVTDPQCIVDLLPGTGGPSMLANCHQEDCTGCNPMGIGGMKNALAANAIAMTLNMRYNVQYNGLTMNGIRSQSLACINVHPCILACDLNGNSCYMRIFDEAGEEYAYPLTVGGLMDLTNYYLGGNANMSIGQSVIYGTGIHETVASMIAYWNEEQSLTACNAGAGIAPDGDENKALPTAIPNTKDRLEFSISPNPASREVTFEIAELAEPQSVVFELYNSLGQQVLRKDLGLVGYVNERIDLGGLGSGLYIVSVKAGGERFEQKLVISKD